MTSLFFYHHRQQDATKSRPFSLALSRTLSFFLPCIISTLSSSKTKTFRARIFDVQNKFLPLALSKKERNISRLKSYIFTCFLVIKGLPRVLHIKISRFLYHRRFSSLLFSSLLLLLRTERVGKRTHRTHPRALLRYEQRE